MLIKPNNLPVKPFMSYAFRQDAEERTLVFKGHTSMAAARRAADASMRAVQAAEREQERAAGSPNTVLMTWGWRGIQDAERSIGMVL